VVDGLVPAGAVTIVYGDSGQGKSFLALYVATCIALGRPVLGLPTERRPVLYIDAELDADEFVRRAYRVARGLGLDRPPVGLHYCRLAGSLTDPAVQAAAQAAQEACDATFVVLDSVGAAAYGGDLERAHDTTALMKSIEAWGTVLAIDHIAKPLPGANLSQYRPFGSTYKYALARSVIQVVRAEGGGLLLRHCKCTFGPVAEPVGAAMDFTPEAVTFARAEVADECLAGIDDHLPTLERTLRALAEAQDGVTPEALAEDLGISAKTVKNHLSALRRQGRAEPVGDGRWRAVSRHPGPGPYKDRDRDGRQGSKPDDDPPLEHAAWLALDEPPDGAAGGALLEPPAGPPEPPGPRCTRTLRPGQVCGGPWWRQPSGVTACAWCGHPPSDDGATGAAGGDRADAVRPP
jgi:DNA-binding transcriptional ArsR family regulator